MRSQIASTIAFAICFFSTANSLTQEIQQPGPEHKKLHEFVGEWDATMDIGGQKSKATAKYYSICNGMWVASDFEGDMGGLQFFGHGIDGYDQTSKKHVGTWVDSISSSQMQFEGAIDPQTNELVMTGSSRGPDGKPQKFKNVTKWQDKDHFTFTMFMISPSNEEQLAFKISYARRPAK